MLFWPATECQVLVAQQYRHRRHLSLGFTSIVRLLSATASARNLMTQYDVTKALRRFDTHRVVRALLLPSSVSFAPVRKSSRRNETARPALLPLRTGRAGYVRRESIARQPTAECTESVLEFSPTFAPSEVDVCYVLVGCVDYFDISALNFQVQRINIIMQLF